MPLGLIGNRAALNHLIHVLRLEDVVAPPPNDEIARELARFDGKMTEVWGLSQGTRDNRCRIIRRLLRAQFGTGPIVFEAINASAIRSFVLNIASSASAISVMGGVVRCRLRYRKLLGEKVGDLQRAVPRRPWRQTSLPEALSSGELQPLLGAFEASYPSRRRGYAIVPCLADLGLRSSEVANLCLGIARQSE